MFSRFRYWSGERHDKFGRTGTNEFARGLICFWCVSVWVATILGIAWYLWNDIIWVVMPLALSTVAIIVNKFTE